MKYFVYHTIVFLPMKLKDCGVSVLIDLKGKKSFILSFHFDKM